MRADTDEEQEGLDKTRVGVLVGSGMGGLQVFQDGVQALVQKGHLVSSGGDCKTLPCSPSASAAHCW